MFPDIQDNGSPDEFNFFSKNKNQDTFVLNELIRISFLK